MENSRTELQRTSAPSPADLAINSATADSAVNLAPTVSISATVSSHQPDFKVATFRNVTLDNTSTPIGIFGTPWTGITAKDLHPLARDLYVRSYTNMKKLALVEVIQLACINRDVYDAQSNKQSTSKRKQKLVCFYRLLKVIFSDEFADALLAGIGNSPSRAQLDCGDAQNNYCFWISLQASFIQPLSNL